jgi:hypothetical protein
LRAGPSRPPRKSPTSSRSDFSNRAGSREQTPDLIGSSSHGRIHARATLPWKSGWNGTSLIRFPPCLSWLSEIVTRRRTTELTLRQIRPSSGRAAQGPREGGAIALRALRVDDLADGSCHLRNRSSNRAHQHQRRSCSGGAAMLTVRLFPAMAGALRSRAVSLRSFSDMKTSYRVS